MIEVMMIALPIGAGVLLVVWPSNGWATELARQERLSLESPPYNRTACGRHPEPD